MDSAMKPLRKQLADPNLLIREEAKKVIAERITTMLLDRYVMEPKPILSGKAYWPK